DRVDGSSRDAVAEQEWNVETEQITAHLSQLRTREGTRAVRSADDAALSVEVSHNPSLSGNQALLPKVGWCQPAIRFLYLNSSGRRRQVELRHQGRVFDCQQFVGATDGFLRARQHPLAFFQAGFVLAGNFELRIGNREIERDHRFAEPLDIRWSAHDDN